MVLYLGLATATAQVLAWLLEWVRRGPHGLAAVRSVVVLGLVGAATLQLTGTLGVLLDQLPTRWVVVGLLDGWSGRWLLTVTVEVALLGLAVVLGAFAAQLAARRTPRDEQTAETSLHPRPPPGPQRPGRPRAHRPCLGLAGGPDAARHHRAGPRPRAGRAGPAT